MSRGPAWSESDDAILRARYRFESSAVLAGELGRTVMAVQSRAFKVLGLQGRGRGVRWTPALDDMVRFMNDVATAQEMADAIGGCTRGAMSQRCLTLGLQKPRSFRAETTRRRLFERSPFTPDIKEIVALLYPDTLTDDIGELVGMSKEEVYAYAKRAGLSKTTEFVRDTARARSGPDHPMHKAGFNKGHRPWNTGLKGLVHPGSVPTQFKKGHCGGAANNNWKPVGSYSVNADGYLVKKVKEGGYVHDVWRAVHRLVWEEAHGPIPAGHVVRFRGTKPLTDPALITVDVLECITLKENALRNAWHRNMPPELRKLVGTRIALTRMTNRRQRELAETS